MKILQSHPELEEMGLKGLQLIYWDMHTPQLYEHAIQRHEGSVAHLGPLVVRTGNNTGRSPKDRYIVHEPSTQAHIAWGEINRPYEADKFNRLFERMKAYIKGESIYVQNCYVGADTKYRMPVRIVTEYAWQALFARNMFVRPEEDELEDVAPEFTVIDLPTFRAMPEIDGTNSEVFIIINFARKLVLIGGTRYAGEMKKSLFSVLNYLLPFQGVLPMHSSANISPKGDTAVFFGLSGTGKTTLSADESRTLIGDDEHGWSDDGVFNFEGGCYAKVIHLSPKGEPEIYQTTRMFGTILENVSLDVESRVLDLDDASFTENTRASYPISHIPNASRTGLGSHPSNIIFLTADAFGVLPPVAKLTIEQAKYHFLSGYTAKVAGTERGITEPKVTFSACFGAPFMPLHPGVYANLLGEKIRKYHVNVWLVNTGWTGGPYGKGKRMSLAHTRAIVNAILDGEIKDVETWTEPYFGLHVPKHVPHVPDEVLNPRETWTDKDDYDRKAKELVAKFAKNFEQYENVVDPGLLIGQRF